MAYCRNCGKWMDGHAGRCPYCGHEEYPPIIRTMDVTPHREDDHLSFLWALLGYLLPPVGIILYFVWKKKLPSRAKVLLIGGLLGILGACF